MAFVMISGKRKAGFTLLEVILVVVISGILGGVIIQVVGDITSGYARQTARQELVGTARAALERMARDVRLAVPGTVWVNNSQKDRITFFLASDAGRYKYSEMNAIGPGGKGESFPVYGSQGFFIDGYQALIVRAGKVKLNSGVSPAINSEESPYGEIQNQIGCRVRLKGNNKNNVDIISGDAFAYNSKGPTYRIFSAKKIVSYFFKNDDKIVRQSISLDDIGGNSIRKDIDFYSNKPSFASDLLVKNVANDSRSKQGKGTWFKEVDPSRNLYEIRLVLTAKRETVPDHVQISVQEEVQVRNGY